MGLFQGSVPLIALLLGCLWLAGAGCRQAAGPAELSATPVGRAILARNLAADELLPAAAMDSVLAAETDLPVGRRLGGWARRFLADGGVIYRFGPAAGGYVAEGLLVSDHRQDCVSLVYRCSELARAADRHDAVAVAVRTRFAGAPLDSLADRDGRVDYDRPEHLDFSLDMIRSGHWGRDLTPDLAGAVPDTAGSSRYRPGSFVYLPTAALAGGAGTALREGDIVWLVLDPRDEAGRRLRQLGLVIGHLGIVILEQGRPWLVHAASRGLPGRYEGGTVVAVPLVEYLQRVDRFCGLLVTRLSDTAVD